MMRTIYSIAIHLYKAGIKTAAAFGHAKAKQMNAGWKHVWEKIDEGRFEGHDTAWFHVSSMGEFEQARPVIEKFKQAHPEWKILVTFFSPSGYEVRKGYPLADAVCYLPMDTPKNARRLLRSVQPKVVYFVKYDFWFNYMLETKRIGAKMYIFSTIFRKQQYFFKWYGGWFLRQLQQFDHMFVQNKESIELLNGHGITRCTIAGDTRFDRVNDITLAAKEFPEIEQFIGNRPVLMAGSSWEPDETNINEFLCHYEDELKVIVAPHMINEEHLKKIEATFGLENCVRYTRLTPERNDARVMIIDTMGMLAAMYRYATIAYIGGGFGQGIHNILEAITFGKPVVFGPRYQKFQEAHDIIRLGGGKTYQAQDELDKTIRTWLEDAEAYNKASRTCKEYVASNLGATDTILNHK